MNIDGLEKGMTLQRLLKTLPDPVEHGFEFNAWLDENLDSFWQIIGSEKVDLHYVRYMCNLSDDATPTDKFWLDNGVFFHISLEDFSCCNVRQAIASMAIDPKTGEIILSSSLENWLYINTIYGPDYFFWRVYDIMDKSHRRTDKFKLVNSGRFKTQLGSLLEMIIK